MDPITIIATVASIGQLAQAALALSKTLYNVGSTVSSASEDIKALADDLKTFSQSLSLLSRLLEDSKAWYSDDVYLLTAKIIKDCAELYEKIDKVLVKLGSNNGKSNWKFRVKFVYKETQIKKLMMRLRDMKGTLATILMSLQVDLQLSLLNISSPSTIQRSSPVLLQAETVQSLKEAQEAFTTGGFLPRYTAQANSDASCSLEPYRAHLLHCREGNALEKVDTNSSILLSSDRMAESPTQTLQHDESTGGSEEEISNSSLKMIVPQKLVSEDTDCGANMSPDQNVTLVVTAKSLRSSASTESFKSALSNHKLDVSTTSVIPVKAVQNILQAFGVALEALESLISKHFHSIGEPLSSSVLHLKTSLHMTKESIQQLHEANYTRHGQSYSDAFTTAHSSGLGNLTSLLMRELVPVIHMKTADYEILDDGAFKSLAEYSERCATRAIEILTSAELLVEGNHGSFEVKKWLGEQYESTSAASLSTTTPAVDHHNGPFLQSFINHHAEALNKEIVEGIVFRHVIQSPSQDTADGTFARPVDMEESPSNQSSPSNSSPIFEGCVQSATSIPEPSNSETSQEPQELSIQLRRDEIAMKKAKLQELKRRREQRKAEQSSGHEDFGRRLRISSGYDEGLVDSCIGINDAPRNQPEFAHHQPNTLWQHALKQLNELDPVTFFGIRGYLVKSFGSDVVDMAYFAPPAFTKDLSECLRGMALETLTSNPVWVDIITMQNNIMKILLMIDDQMGLENAAIGWSCAYTYLSIFQPLLATPPEDLSTELLPACTSVFQSVQNIASLIARYSVMESLYNSSRIPLTLKPAYKSSLIQLCTSILEYFFAAFAFAKMVVDEINMEGGKRGRIDELVIFDDLCDKSYDTVLEKDRVCRTFSIVVEEVEESGFDSSDSDVSEVTDEELEEIGGLASGTGVMLV